MLKFERFEGPYGIPVFYQELPAFVKSTALALTVFTGSADDTTVGEQGLYHWFEHVPFQGTQKFPGGYRATKGPVVRVGGRVGAWTNPFCTTYKAALPTRELQIGLDVVIDLVARPLLTDEAIAAERRIIHQEIRDKMGSIDGMFAYTVGPRLFPNHPLGNHTLGSADSLDRMTPEILREAREKGYDRSRMAFFVSTAMSAAEFLGRLNEPFSLLPSHGLSERRCSASFGPVEWKSGRREVWETEFANSVVAVIFPVAHSLDKVDVAKYALLKNLFSYGSSGSPLYNAVREKKQLAYGASASGMNSRDGSYVGFYVKTSAANIDATEEALREMFRDEQLRSRQWFEDVRAGMRGALEMEVINPDDLVGTALWQTSLAGATWTREEGFQIGESFTHEEAMGWIDNLRFEEAQTFVAKGVR